MDRSILPVSHRIMIKPMKRERADFGDRTKSYERAFGPDQPEYLNETPHRIEPAKENELFYLDSTKSRKRTILCDTPKRLENEPCERRQNQSRRASQAHRHPKTEERAFFRDTPRLLIEPLAWKPQAMRTSLRSVNQHTRRTSLQPRKEP